MSCVDTPRRLTRTQLAAQAHKSVPATPRRPRPSSLHSPPAYGLPEYVTVYEDGRRSPTLDTKKGKEAWIAAAASPAKGSSRCRTRMSSPQPLNDSTVKRVMIPVSSPRTRPFLDRHSKHLAARPQSSPLRPLVFDTSKPKA